ncbi:aromatic ring-hydroxylating dioxygenase subunit alpha [Novosphingobium sp. ST904]|uniref:aromatic ring-hydroxylating oxygenase subunit alpha n=1 Tax=Novosphingobium sp. ST904 TaxID=1684385 RepID=UPI0006C8C177|nr:aromatic ring-hydroxylating dioxygenase subunit alpha [Novosphingobium sp. ST904]KPH66086.1 (2Fe-2S)-binding protein [Novosphingobium sp. ST904]TCM27774.1 Rieske-like 2Fe-2S protein [Novosphingobium sp. ST904]
MTHHPDHAALRPSLSEEDLTEPLTYGVEAFLSRDYAQAEHDLLWPKVWQQAGRVEEIPEVGDFISYEVGEESIIIARTGPDAIRAYFNVCPHRGRRLIDVPAGEHSASGNRRSITCGFHGWSFDLEGRNTFILDRQDWKGCLDNPERTELSEVKVDTWGGWLFVSMDPKAPSLRDYLEPAASMLDQFELERMRYKWRQWVVFDCNWKTALEAFMEPYHVAGTHTQLLEHGDYYSYSAAHGLHGVSGFDQRDADMRISEGSTVTRAGKSGIDPRVSTYELQEELYATVNQASTTATLVTAAGRLVDELPEGTPTDQVIAHWLASAKADDAARGVEWPEITPAQMGQAGLAWHIFPNMAVLQGITFALCYRARPYGNDPDKCVFEAYAIERFPAGQEPKTSWVEAAASEEHWGLVLAQDFSNMAAVQKGMKSRGFRGTLPNPHQERKVTNFHRNLAHYMKRAAPHRLN